MFEHVLSRPRELVFGTAKSYNTSVVRVLRLQGYLLEGSVIFGGMNEK